MFVTRRVEILKENPAPDTYSGNKMPYLTLKQFPNLYSLLSD